MTAWEWVGEWADLYRVPVLFLTIFMPLVVVAWVVGGAEK